MTDNAERKVREWAKGRNGDPLTSADVVELVLAVDADGDARHQETLERLDDVDERHVTLCLRVSELEQASVGCSERVRAYVEKEHGERHEKHMSSSHGEARRKDDPPDSAFLEARESAFPGSVVDDRSFREMMMAWSATKKVLAVIASALILILVGVTVSYIGGYFASQRAEQEFLHIEQTTSPAPQPTVTVTATPLP